MISVSEELGNYESSGIAGRAVHDEASRCLHPGLGLGGKFPGSNTTQENAC